MAVEAEGSVMLAANAFIDMVSQLSEMVAYHGGQSFGRSSRRENWAGMTPMDD